MCLFVGYRGGKMSGAYASYDTCHLSKVVSRVLRQTARTELSVECEVAGRTCPTFRYAIYLLHWMSCAWIPVALRILACREKGKGGKDAQGLGIQPMLVVIVYIPSYYVPNFISILWYDSHVGITYTNNLVYTIIVHEVLSVWSYSELDYQELPAILFHLF
ncbi:hypothetical protein F4678DRAFT_449034 [Xylaria arbuscula]|nr:hypothetical protein F4678DRAFT_449034 [Xylaria arbuscula]